MEKFRKFADEKNGINPFINAPRLKKRSLFNKIIRYPLIFLASIKLLLFLILFFLYSLLQFLKIKPINSLISKVFLLLLGVYSIKKTASSEKVENQIKSDLKNKKKVVIFSSQSTIIDWISLIFNHSPSFYYIVKSINGDEDLLVKLSTFQVFQYGIGVKIPTYSSKNNKKITSTLISEIDSSSPIVIFPEGTKTTREATLNIHSNVLNQIYDEFLQERLTIYCEILVYKYTYFCPNNTTDRKGFLNLLQIMSQVYNSVQLQMVKINKTNFDVDNIDKSLLKEYKNKYFYFDSLIQEHLTYTEFRTNNVSFNCLKHIEFLDFYEKNMSSSDYINK